MKIIKETDTDNLKWVVYCVLFDTGHFYIGSSENFKSRQNNHINQILNKKEPYGFLKHTASFACQIFIIRRFEISHVATDFEKNLLLSNITNPLILNRYKGEKQIFNANQLIWQKLKDLSEDL